MLVKFDPRLSFFTRFSAVILTMLDKPYMHYQRFKNVVFYNVMQGTTQAHLLVKMLKSRTLSSFRNLQNVASSSGLVKISVNWSSVLTPSNEISFLATWSLRKWWRIYMCFGARVLNRIISKLYRTLIVTQKGYRF